MTDAVCLTTCSEAGTVRAGERVGSRLPAGAILALVGELGSGKTRFAKGVGLALGIREEEVTSPTFTLARVHTGTRALHHIDAYRLSGPAEFESLALLETLGNGVAVVEWADRVATALPTGVLTVRFEVLGPEERRLTFASEDRRYRSVAEALAGWEEGIP